MNPLRELRMFVNAKASEYDYLEIREYVTENAVSLAQVFEVTEDRLIEAVAKVEDQKLVAALLGQIKTTEGKVRAKKADGKASAAQLNAESLAGAYWEDSRVNLNMRALMSSSLTKRDSLLVFRCESFEVAIPMAPLIGLAKFMKRDVAGFVDVEGLHVRWNGGKGGLNLRSQPDPDAARIIIQLPARSSSSVAA